MLDLVRSIEAVDQHAHNVSRPESCPPLEAAFTESMDPRVWERDVPHTLFFQRSVNQLAELYSCAPESDSLRRVLREQSVEQRTARCFQGARLKGLLLDDGLNPEAVFPWTWHQQFVPTRRILRWEHLAQDLLAQHTDFQVFEEAFREELSQAQVAGFKCIAAYRGGLNVPEASRDEARQDFGRVRTSRLAASPLYSFLVRLGLEVASERSLPVQFHTGFGDPDLALEQSNPLWLRPLIENYSCPFVLLHGGYPYTRELGFLCSVYLNVWADFGLAVPFLSRRGMVEAVSALLELAPINKILYSSDASLIPELFYLGSVNGREVLAEVLEGCVKDGDLSRARAEQAADQILAGNARQLYSLT